MKKCLPFLTLIIFLFACSHANNEKSDEKKTEVKENPYKNSKIEINTFQNKDSSWGYDVSIDGQKSIIQPNIPSLPGNRGFNTSDEAKKTGEFAAYKIHNNIMPPTLNKAELDSLGVLK